MIEKKDVVSSTQFAKGLVTRSDILRSTMEQSPNCMDIKWNFDGSIQKRLGFSSANTVTIGSTGVTGWTIDSNGTLTTSLQAYYKLDEASGTRADSYDGAPLNDFNSVSSIVGIRGNAALFTAANSQSLMIATTSPLETGNINFSMAGWFYLNSTSTTKERSLISKRNISALLTSFETGADNNLEIGISGSGTVRRGAQSFQIAAGYTVTGASVYLKRNTGDTQLTVRIETDAAGVPSGTLANANATATIEVASVPTADYAFLNVTFNGPFSLTAGTTYWLVCKLTSESGGEKIYVWGKDSSSPSYASGNAAQYNDSWAAEAGNDALFKIIGLSDYEYYLFVNTDNILTFRVSSSGITQDSTVRATSLGAVTTSTWYNFVAWHSNGQHIGISVNLSVNTALYTGGLKVSSAPFVLGGISNGPTQFMDGRIDEVGFWKKSLSLQERRDIYGGGTGNTFSAGASGFAWAMFDFGASSIRWLTVAAGSGLLASSNLGTTFVTIATSRTQTYQYLDRSKNVLIATSDAYDVPLYWAGSAGSFAAALAPNSAPNVKYNINYQGFLILLNSSTRKRGFFYADENLQLTDTWTNGFDIPSSADDEITAGFVLNKFLYISTKYKIYRVAFVGGNPDWAYLKIKDFGFVPRTLQLVSLKGGQVAVGMDWQRRLRVFDGGYDDLFLSDAVENDNRLCEFAMKKISLAGSGLVISHAAIDPNEQEYRLNVAIGMNSTQTTHAIVLNARTLAMYPYSNQQFQCMAVAESANRQYLMAADRSGFVHILNSGNMDVATPINEFYDSPLIFSNNPETVSKMNQINLFFSVDSCGKIYYQDRADLSTVFSNIKILKDFKGNSELLGSEQVIQILRTIDISSTQNIYEFRLTSSAGTANPWKLARFDLINKALGIGRGNG